MLFIETSAMGVDTINIGRQHLTSRSQSAVNETHYLDHRWLELSFSSTQQSPVSGPMLAALAAHLSSFSGGQAADVTER